MLYLIGSIVLTSYLTLSFKMLERMGISSFQAIVFNYITCVITGSIVNQHFPIRPSLLKEDWLPWALLMGTTFISLFNLIAYVTRNSGVSVATVANKLSLVIPFVFSIVLYGERLRFIHVIGIIIALAAVVLTCLRKTSQKISAGDPKKKNMAMLYLLPFILFLGSGLLDTMIKYVEQGYLNESNHNAYLIAAFAVAALIGVVTLGIAVITGREKLSYKAVFAGMAIGVPNYFSFWCLLTVLKAHAGESAAIIPVNNMGIVLFSAVAAWLLFRERLSAVNWTGILLSMVSIALIAFG